VINIFRKKRDYSGAVSSPEERVKAFVAHWHEQWTKARRKMGKNVDFDYWGDLVSQVDKTHFVEGAGSGSRNSFGSKPDYDPESENVTDCEIRGELAQVYAEQYEKALKSTTYHVYQLERGVDGNWLISQVLTLLYPPKDPVVDADTGARALAMSDMSCPLIAPEENLALDENVLFQDGRTVEVPHSGDGTTEVREIGKLQIRSGVVAIMDFGYNIYDLEPLHRKVTAGSYPVETVEIHDRVAGIRVRFSEDQCPARWYAAKTPTGNGVYGVDAGNLAIMDVEGLLELSHLKKEALYSDWAHTYQPQMLSMSSADDCVITSSGFGDGAYPAFWGVDENEQLVSLYIDFMILVQETDDGALVTI